MSALPEPLELMGAPGSPYTRKMLALLRYRRIPHAIHWASHRNPPTGYPKPPVELLPTFYFPKADGDLEAVVDSTPITRRLEREYLGRSTLPSNPVLGFLNYLIEDYADEWLTKCMFHFRWAHRADAENAGPLLIFWNMPTMPDADAQPASDSIAKRQIDRLYVVGSNAVTAETIESSYARMLHILDSLVQRQGYVLGARPSSADFALYGQLTQLAIVEPTSARITEQISRRIRAWVDRVEDLSGLTSKDSDWASQEAMRENLKPLLAEIGRVYVPFLLANAQAVMTGAKSFETTIDGRAWSQPTFPYQAKCLKWIRDEFSALSFDGQHAVRALFAGTGCETLLAGL
ncbi:MAG TPA: glutathione S-transferase family protein [Hyphomonadaceae bacterium]|nr:glutathione S-transferase family protein [Hyphomonadaceae bacterium]